MLDELLLHPVTKEALLAVIQAKPHALMIRGKVGSGKSFTAKIVAADLLGCLPDKLEKHPYFLNITLDSQATNQTIKIEQIRELKRFLQLKTAGQSDVRRVVVIEDVMTMGDEAQNALLKMLEEPPEDTVIILTSTNSALVRPTILSRVQIVTLLTPPAERTKEYFIEKGYSDEQINKAIAVSQGSVAITQALLGNQEHPLLEQIKMAKQILAADSYQRLTQIEKLSKDRATVESLLDALNTICSAALQQTAKTNDANKIKRWYTSLIAVDQAEQALKRKPSNKLLLTNLFMQL